MKHSRSRAFDSALADPPTGAAHWSDVAPDPNDPRVMARRAVTLRAAWRDPIEDRLAFLMDRCRDRRILDIGCVAHDVERMKSPDWLHGRLAVVAASCLGVDVLAEGAEHMRTLGYDVIVHDLTTGPGPVAAKGPFDVIVAGELIEHVPSLDMLFTAARDLLSPDGQLIITTPNPWTPARVAAGQRGDCWENVDHIMFAFPSGIAELAERHDLVLSEATTTAPTSSRSSGLRDLARTVRRRVRGTGWASVGFATRGPESVVRIDGGKRVLPTRGPRTPMFVGGTFVYVVRRPAADG
ncbi:MAG: class I SAM-dependent methyltransferase [Knoellia sp.]